MDAFDAAFSPGKASPAPTDDAFSAAFAAPSQDGEDSKPGLIDLYTGGRESRAGLAKAAESSAAGLKKGVEDVFASFDPVAERLSSALPFVDKIGTTFGLASALPKDNTLSSLVTGDTQSDVSRFHADSRHAFDQQYDEDPNANIGRLVGNVAASAPLYAAGGEVAAAAKALPLIADTAEAANVVGQSNKLARAFQVVARGGIQGATGAALVSGGSDQPVSDQIEQGAEIGAVLGPAAAATSKGGRAVANLVTGGGVNPKVAELAQLAEQKFGIPVRGGQISESPFVKFADSSLPKVPFTGYAEKDEAARLAFTRAVSRTFGADSDSLTPEVMSEARTRIGGEFNRVAANTTIRADNEFKSALAGIEEDASQVLSDSELRPIKNQLSNILSKVSNGELSGEVYQTLTRKGAPLDRAMSSADPNVRSFASDIRDTLDNALEKAANPEDLAALRKARLQWKNMRTVQDLAVKAGIEGEITPSALLGAVKKSYKDMAYSGAGDIGEIAQIGQQFLKPQPSSGTAERLAFLHTLRSGGGLLTAGLAGGAAATNPVMSLAGVGGFLGASKLTGSILDSKWYKNRLLASIAEHPEAASRIPPEVMDALRNYGVPSTVIGLNRLRESSSPVNP